MKRIISFLLVIILSLSMAFGLTGCRSNAVEIKKTLTEFQTSCRDMDVDGMLKCIDPDISDPIRLVLVVVRTVSGKDLGDLVNSLFDFSDADLGVSINYEEFLDSIEVIKPKLKIRGKKATVNCKLSFVIAGQTFIRDARIDMVKKNDQWYIAGFDMFSSNE